MATGNEGDGTAWTVIVSGGAVLANLFIAGIGWVWSLGRSSKSADVKIAQMAKVVTEELNDMERRLHADIDNSTRQFGETVSAIRTKVTEIELWNRDNFVSKGTFKAVTDEMKRSWERFEDNLNDKLEAIDKKLDRNNPAI